MKALLILCCFGFSIVSVKPHNSFANKKVNAQDTTEITILKRRVISAEKESYAQRKIAEKHVAKICELEQLLKECKAKQN